MCPVDAAMLDTSDMTFEEVVAAVVTMVHDAVDRAVNPGGARR